MRGMTKESNMGRRLRQARSSLVCCCTIVLLCCIDRGASFNYDYSSACTRPYRSSRMQYDINAPCDLSKQTYCNRPGSTYPWHAVRRFVHENQGLMRRMYGEQRHISVLKAEIVNNDLESDTLEVPIRDSDFARYSKDRDVINTKFVYSKRATGRSSDYPNTVPHFRPVQTTPSTTTSSTTPGTTASSSSGTTKKNKPKQSLKSADDDAKMAAYKTSFFEDEIDIHDMSKNNLELNKIEPEMISLEAAIKQSLETNSVYPNYADLHSNLTMRGSASTTSKTTSSTSTTAGQTIETSPIDTTTPEYVTPVESTGSQELLNEEPTDDGWKPVVMSDKLSTLPPTMLFSESVKVDNKNKNDRIDTNVDGMKETMSTSTTGGESSSSSSSTASTANLEAQLYQDAVQEEPKPPVVKLRGVNACPVKEEVVAPFWANNTRGEVLALLNLYPFEQYVHWEKCAHEHKQMFCREGCRCEQQYRLHRLLAYDPNNECRGIFADWFRFPSCCVCKCYDMPLEFRVTSRSPRTIEPDIEESVKREMYAQAASDWYTINLDD